MASTTAKIGFFYKGSNSWNFFQKLVLVIIFYRLKIETSSLLLCAAFLMLFQGIPHLPMLVAIIMLTIWPFLANSGHFWPYS